MINFSLRCADFHLWLNLRTQSTAYNTCHDGLFQPLEGDNDKDRSVDKKYKEIKDKKRSAKRKSSPTVYLGHPSINNISSCKEDVVIQRGNEVTCPTCRGTGVIQTGIYNNIRLLYY